MNFLVFPSARFAPKDFKLPSGVIFLIESREVTHVTKLTQLLRAALLGFTEAPA